MILAALGGLAVFLIGIRQIARTLDAVAGTHLRRSLTRATHGSVRALALGTFVSAATQSGTALAVTALSLINAGLVAFREGLALSLGAKIGGTLAIQLAAFKIYDYALPIIAVGFLASLWRPTREASHGVIGIGLLFLGLDLLITSLAGIGDSALFALLIESAGTNPLLVALVGIGIAMIVQSSNAAVALALGLFAAGAIPLPAALALVIGGNIGSTLLPYVASTNLGIEPRRVAVAHMLYKAAFGTLLLAMLPLFEALVHALGGTDARQIANAHTFFNLLAALPALALMPAIDALTKRLVRSAPDDTGPKYIRDVEPKPPHEREERSGHPDAALAASLASREIVRVSDQVKKMMTLAIPILRTGSGNTEEIAFREAKVDRLTQAIVQYLARTRAPSTGTSPNDRTRTLLLITSELEHIGDQIRRLLRKQDKVKREGIEFSVAGRAELARAGRDVDAYLESVFTALATRDPRLLHGLRSRARNLQTHLEDLRLNHLERLESGLPESRASSAQHLDTLTVLGGITGSGSRIAEWIAALGETAPGAVRPADPDDDDPTTPRGGTA